MERFPNTGNFLRGRLRDHLSEEQKQAIEDLVASVEQYAGGDVLVERGQVCERSLILIEGKVLRCISDEEDRYTVGIHVPGDFVDLHGFALKRLDHDIVAVGPVKVGTVPHDRLEELIARDPVLARVLWFATLLDAAIHRNWIMMLEKLNAAQRVAHVFCELHYRLTLIGRGNARVLRTPLTQQDLAQMCGVTSVHVNRAIRRLKELDIGEVRRGDFYTSDWAKVCAFAGFKPDYLYGEPPLQLTEI